MSDASRSLVACITQRIAFHLLLFAQFGSRASNTSSSSPPFSFAARYHRRLATSSSAVFASALSLIDLTERARSRAVFMNRPTTCCSLSLYNVHCVKRLCLSAFAAPDLRCLDFSIRIFTEALVSPARLVMQTPFHCESKFSSF